jgi:DICT domain-containing protein
VFGIALITNMAAGMSDEKLTHSAVWFEVLNSRPRLTNIMICRSKWLRQRPGPDSSGSCDNSSRRLGIWTLVR